MNENKPACLLIHDNDWDKDRTAQWEESAKVGKVRISTRECKQMVQGQRR